MRESLRRDLIPVVLTLVIAGLLYTLALQGSRRVAAAPVAAPTFTPIVASTATPPAQLRPDQPVAVSMVEGRDQLLLNLLARIERQLAEAQAAEEKAIPPAAVVVPPTATPTPALSVWEDGTCWTPADMQVLALCGADAGDGYVVRWIGVHGDSRGPEIPDADWLAVRGGGDRLVWSGHHPTTGELVTVNYWSGGHTLAVHAAGRLLVRIDREHRVK